MAEMESALAVIQYILQMKLEAKYMTLITLWMWWTERNSIRLEINEDALH